MKTAMSVVITIGVILLAVIAVLVLSRPALAGDDDYQHSNYTSSKHNDIGKGISVGVVLTCTVRLIYTLAADTRWTWCGEDNAPEPLPDPGPALKVTPDNLQDNNYLIEVK